MNITLSPASGSHSASSSANSKKKKKIMHFRFHRINIATETELFSPDRPKEFEYLQPQLCQRCCCPLHVRGCETQQHPAAARLLLNRPALPICSHVSRPDGISASRLALASGLGITLKRCAIKLLNSQTA